MITKKRLTVWSGNKPINNIPIIRKQNRDENINKNIIKVEPNTIKTIPDKYTRIKGQDQKNTQENTQDLDQTQNVDITPSQTNIQKLQVTVNNKLENYSGSITGITYGKDMNQVLGEVVIWVYFGSNIGFPVYNTTSDIDGKFVVEDLPAGYYTIKAKKGKEMETLIYNIKVLPGQSCYNFILMNDKSKN